MHLLLVGLPGAGKSTLGPLVAAQLGIDFVDLDHEIEQATGRPIGEIFALGGEAMFRRREFEATERLRRRPASVVAPGGGWIAQPQAVALLRPPARIIHLRVSPATALTRMGSDAASRPLLTGDVPLRVLQSLMTSRATAYGSADAELDTETLSLQELVAQTAQLASSWGVGVG